MPLLAVRRWHGYAFGMKTVTVSGHVEGNSIQLDEPFDLPAGAKLLITVIPVETADASRSQWIEFAKEGLARAYGDDEPDYPTPSKDRRLD
jgi:hypothetical protein